MKSRAVAAVVVAVVAGTLAATANAAVATVNPYACATFSGGSVTRPAGSTIVVRQGLAEQQLGILTALLRDQTTTVSINGGSAVDLSGSWPAPTQAQDGSWVSFVEYPTGITLGAGQSLTITFSLTIAHRLPEIVKPTGQPVFNEPGTTTWTCTVTGA